MIRAYLAGNLFSTMERRFNRELKAALEAKVEGLEVQLPQDYKVHGRIADKRAYGHVYRACIAGIEEADLVIALLEGEAIDSGTAYECGYAKALGKPVIGVRSDFRPNQELGMNLMLSRGLDKIVRRMSFDENLDGLARDLARHIRRMMKSKG